MTVTNYKDLADKYCKRNVELQQRIAMLLEDIEQLEFEVATLHQEHMSMRARNERLEAEIEKKENEK